MATRLILPDYIVSGFIPHNACGHCGRSDMNFKLLYPRLRWGKTDIELIYPLRCPCGGSGHICVELPTLLFGYILATVASVDAHHRRRSKATMIVSHSRDSDMLARMFRDFDRLMNKAATVALLSPPVPSSDPSKIDDLDAAAKPFQARCAGDDERIKFGFDKEEWKAFLRRLGFDAPGG